MVPDYDYLPPAMPVEVISFPNGPAHRGQSFAIAWDFVLRLNSMPHEPSRKGRSSLRDGEEPFGWTRSYTISPVMRKSGFIPKCQSTRRDDGLCFPARETGR